MTGQKVSHLLVTTGADLRRGHPDGEARPGPAPLLLHLPDALVEPGDGRGDDPHRAAALVAPDHGVALAEVRVPETKQRPVSSIDNSLETNKLF